jgi:hypothetical protein
MFCGANLDHLRNLRCLFLCFEAVLGLRINLAKSELVPIGNVNNVEGLANILGCRVSSLPLKYLGLSLGASFKAKSIWDGIIEKIERCLAGWKMMYLSKGGRVTLIKSTLSNLPTYFMSLFPLPVGVANRIEKLQRDFLWGGIGDEFKFHLVSWSKVCSRSLKEGWGSIIYFRSTELCWGSGFGVMFMRERPYGGWLWILNMVARGVGGVLMRFMGRMGWGLWKNIRRGWGSFLVTLDLRLVMAPKLDSGMTCGVGIRPSR